MRENLNYDKKNVFSIYQYALKLTGQSLAEVVDINPETTNIRNRGDLGTLVEKYYFKHQPIDIHSPDFAEAGLELKTTGVLKKNATGFQAKERLVLTMINYEAIAKETWETSSFLKKCKLMLILFYLYSKEVPVEERKFVLEPYVFAFPTKLGFSDENRWIEKLAIPDEDAIIIKKDWEFIRNKVLQGKAHELSEGDTFFLGACRKGSGGESEALRSQPFSSEKAKGRAFSFKQSYINRLIDGHVQSEFSLGMKEGLDFREVTKRKFAPYIGKSVEEISKLLAIDSKSKNYKSFNRALANRILGGNSNSVPELEGAGVEMKTIRLSSSGKPRESMSFPGFKFLEIVNEEWEESSFFLKIERKFLFVIFGLDSNGIERLMKVEYWNMPYEDRLEARRVWEETKRRVQIDATDLPKSRESSVAHVRPKARDGNDKQMTPQGTLHLKQCFWLNKEYIGKIIDNL
jgi:DNA mismatch repair protein MutH